LNLVSGDIPTRPLEFARNECGGAFAIDWCAPSAFVEDSLAVTGAGYGRTADIP
jgi:hypothetical protein